MKTAVCLECGKTFQTYPCRRAKFCSVECYRKYWKENVLKKKIIPKRTRSITIICEYCGKPFKVWPSRMKRYNVRFCSKECFDNYKRTHPEEYGGENHWNWKGGITEINRKLRRSKEYKEWQKAVFKRDRWTCQICGYKGHDLVAHHILPFSEYPELRFDPDNGITLCRRCHKKLHYDIGEETRFEKNQRPHNKLPIPPKEELEKLYWEMGWSTLKIAEKYGVCHKTVRKWLKHHNIRIRSFSEARINYLRRASTTPAPELEKPIKESKAVEIVGKPHKG